MEKSTLADTWNLVFLAVLGYFEEFLCLILDANKVTNVGVNFHYTGYALPKDLQYEQGITTIRVSRFRTIDET